MVWAKENVDAYLYLTLSCTSRLALWTNSGSLSIISWLVSCAAVLSVFPSWLFRTVANSLAAFCTYTAWMWPGRVATFGRSMASSVCIGFSRCLRKTGGFRERLIKNNTESQHWCNFQHGTDVTFHDYFMKRRFLKNSVIPCQVIWKGSRQRSMCVKRSHMLLSYDITDILLPVETINCLT